MISKLCSLAVLFSVLVFLGCNAMDPVAPSSNDGTSVNPAAAPVIVTVAPIAPFPGSMSGITGEATLTRSIDGLWVDQDIEGLTPGYAYSVWWAIFENSKQCVGSVCVPSDLATRQVQGSLVNGGGFVAEGTTQSYSSHLARHDVEGKQVQLGDPSGIDNPYRAQVHLVLRSHGLAETDPADLAVQTSTFNGFCNLPPDPPGVCQNVTAAVFMTPGAPGQAGTQ